MTTTKITTKNGNIVKGSYFPRHLQVAFGRNIARMEACFNVPCKIWLRDLPLNLWDLEFQGYPYALLAYLKESKALEGRGNHDNS